MRSTLLFSLLALATTAAAAQAVVRCEAADGKVTYAQTACPPGTQPVRALGAPGQPTTEDQKAAIERARKESSQIDRIERNRKAEEARAAKAQQTDKLRADARARPCRRLALRVKQAKEDAATATLNRAPDAKRRLKKAQENYELECGAGK